ncbi:uncharacterized protein LOC100890866 [Strongylocentrotus purpuratus]|uniref:ZSWIM1/3 RNaseH-like domain-containing protein n=1 Tax=Strongylocentrotus purpuratus TaxID=7668 RepID=A0A7M7P6R9_STRPU|nr:uncharacterized protein LOC100890866 [Strongylocentrotus purpuratus]
MSQQISLCVQDAASTSQSGTDGADAHTKMSCPEDADIRMLPAQASQGRTETDARTKLSCPEDADIRYHVQAAQVIHTYSKLQPRDLEDHVAQLKLVHEDHNVFFRKQSFRESVLLVHQTVEQQQTIASYPTEKYFLDSTCKTTEGALPLILLSVQANGSHQIVGSAILQEKSSRLMQEALEIFKSWNPTWKPVSFTAEFEEEDIEGVKKAFHGVPILLCDYHRVSAWSKWITETRNFIIGSKGALLSILEALSNASTKEMYHKLLEQLQDSSYWKEDERLCKWFGSRWLPCCEVSLFC